MKDIKALEKVYLEKYDVNVTPYLTYAQIEQMIIAVGEMFNWAERQVNIDMLLLAHTTDISKQDLEQIGHKKLFESGLIGAVRKTVLNYAEFEKALEYHTSLQKNLSSVLKKLTPDFMEKVKAVVTTRKK